MEEGGARSYARSEVRWGGAAGCAARWGGVVIMGGHRAPWRGAERWWGRGVISMGRGTRPVRLGRETGEERAGAY